MLKKSICILLGSCLYSPYIYAEEDHSLNTVIQNGQKIKQIEDQRQIEKFIPTSPYQGVNDIKNLIEKEEVCFTVEQLDLIILNERSIQEKKQFNFLLQSLDDKKKNKVTGECVGTKSLHRILNFLQNELIIKGYITSTVSVEPQDLASQKKLVFTLLVGRFGQFIQTDPKASLSQSQLRAAFAVKEHDALNIRVLDQGIDNLKGISDLAVKLELQPIKEENCLGYSDVELISTGYKKLNVNMGLDDSGGKTNGIYNLSLGATLNNVVGFNDTLSANYSRSIDNWHYDRNYNSYLSYEVPYRYYNLNLSYNRSYYDQRVAGYKAPLLYHGNSEQTNITLSRLVSRGTNYKTSIYTRGYHRSSQNFIDDLEIEVQRRRTTGWNLGLKHKQYLGQTLVDASIDYRRGSGALKAKRAPEEDIHDINQNLLPSEGYARAPIWSADIRVNMPITLLNSPAQYRLNWHGQYAPQILVPQDRFYIGGRYSVRGFDGNNMLVGDSGHYLQQEISMNIPIKNTQMYLGIDQGWVNGSNSFNNQRYLMGSVLGLRTYSYGFYLDTFVGHGVIAPKSVSKDWTAGFSLNFSY
ncbi:ShlB/FhaC/HecB family hemolysin secretion/activation protein [Acinetobacter sp. HY1485]|uniref:ShlB/FhaC/HecB family hemolysin secretion/activation protein n=1 Tax=Acinetobacter sp. HY1485 TaxID=2970918 RepID=UPI0022B97A2F|nr:ShlB/FhaC/HecB family hemolysin secretion/activation protein [Acinetobacter sp. HY1485]